jgi:hypothetical protein
MNTARQIIASEPPLHKWINELRQHADELRAKVVPGCPLSDLEHLWFVEMRLGLLQDYDKLLDFKETKRQRARDRAKLRKDA